MKTVFRYVVIVILAIATSLILTLPLLPTTTAGSLFFLPYGAIPLFFFTLLALLLMWKHKKERCALLCILLSSLIYLHLYLPDVFSSFYTLEERQKPGTLTIVSWNADNFQLNEDTLHEATTMIQSLHPDIICLQERPHTSLLNTDKIKKMFAGYPYMVTNNREDEVLNVIVFSRYPLTRPRPHYFEGTFNKYLSVDVLLPDSISPWMPRLRLYDIHLQTTGLSDTKHVDKKNVKDHLFSPFRSNSILRNQQADIITKDIAQSPYPVMVCGDFNDIRTSYAYRTIAHRLKDTYQGVSGSYIYHTATISRRLSEITHCRAIPVKIDHILVSSPLQPTYYIQPSYLSGDHRMQCAVIKLPR